ncbi:hypothetical protein conserved [Leishmania donovani]|uniref:Uncharacterized protein n=5 Tax=Leishmania donovani species complex TaxID=38574 RepID=A4HVZ4_LEIIN|nr:conserved hypothetical protein [Leishmania infantum JPCM5]XP_003859424.1 hypothetical protein, conserved [Leishmania donovani]CAC9468549.1 hypothetical_protein_-_conserved [Leishmania infantum]AYU77299.1 hypothetical protein LdCL_140010700 [Leishmania donovani]TPP53496.1 hypothetical protein CGC20_38675 [Leishmania donovani]CAJ1987320.1 hypothetical protein conserved [Leishmania donovani]CAM66613.1 conserved hypothetical protein [Leishmania infantum JPCM5]|eukprot:XP_001464235.1 conserved hypothetical protein [Leishmania infantum JPCM5]
MTRQADEQKSMRKVTGSGEAEKTSKLRTDDLAALQERMKKLHAEVTQQSEAKEQRARELAAVPVADEDVQVVAAALTVTPECARSLLQEKNGDVTAVLRDAVGLPKARA